MQQRHERTGFKPSAPPAPVALRVPGSAHVRTRLSSRFYLSIAMRSSIFFNPFGLFMMLVLFHVLNVTCLSFVLAEGIFVITSSRKPFITLILCWILRFPPCRNGRHTAQNCVTAPRELTLNMHCFVKFLDSHYNRFVCLFAY